jgi:hypothetical protein
MAERVAARGELAFPGLVGGVTPALTELQRIAELERKIVKSRSRTISPKKR